MALTRKMLKAMGIEEEKIDQIIEAHTDTIESIKEERDQYKEEAEKLPAVQKKLDDALAAANENSDEDKWKAKYDELKSEFDAYKNDQSAKEVKAAKETAYKQLLKDAGISEKRIDSVLKVSDLSEIELDKEGKIKSAEKIVEHVKSEWSDFIVSNGEQGASTANPPSNTGASTFESMSLADKMAYANEHPNAVEVTNWLQKS